MKAPDKKLGIIIIMIVIIIIAAVAFFLLKDKPFFKNLFKPKQAPELDVDKAGKKIDWSSDEFPLKKGSSGAKVKQLQAGLNIQKKNNLVLDGKFGEKTLAALKEGFGVDTLSEANYNTYILPNIAEINDYMNASHPANKGGSTPSPIVNSSLIGKSVFANKDCEEYLAKKIDGSYIIDDTKKVNKAKDQYIGVVEQDNGTMLRCTRTDYTRVYVLKSNVRTA